MDHILPALKKIIKSVFNVSVEPTLTRPDEQFGDFATNVALQLAGQLDAKPRVIAEQLVEALKPALTKEVQDITIAGPGFINFVLSDKSLLELAAQAPTQKPQTYKGKTVVAEYSDPNAFKVLHAGHLYTTLVGDSIARLLEGAGAKMHRVNYGGDVGLHVGRAMWAILKATHGKPEALADVPKAERATWVSQRYVEGNKAYETDPEAKAEIIAINKQAYQLHEQNDHTSVFAQIYWTCRQWSYDGFDALYKQLQVHPFERYIPESEVTPKALAIVHKGLQEKVFTVSDGATIFKGEDHGLHTRVFINSQGIPLYEAKDLGLAAMKWQDYKYDLSFIITGNDIVEYMKVVVKALEHFYPQAAKRGRHLTHGMIKMPGGAKMSSRQGNILQATDILDAAAAAVEQTRGHSAQDTMLAAVKYAFLKHRIGGGMIYDPQESVSLEGNSGPYLQYAHARACSILAKAGAVAEVPEGGFEPAERTLARKISEYPEVIHKATTELMPHHICGYLYELAQTFNRFYEVNRVIGDPRQAQRLQLVNLYANVLRDGLHLLGITAPDKL